MCENRRWHQRRRNSARTRQATPDTVTEYEAKPVAAASLAGPLVTSQELGINLIWQHPATFEAECFFFNTIASESASNWPYRGYMTDVQDIYQKSNLSSQISFAVTSVAKLALGRHRNNLPLIEDAKRVYNLALRCTIKGLSFRSVRTSDEMLLSIICLCRFEVKSQSYCGARIVMPSPMFLIHCQHIWDSSPPDALPSVHGKSLPSIINDRGFKQLQHATSRRLFFTLQNQLVRAQSQSLILMSKLMQRSSASVWRDQNPSRI